MNSHHIHQCLVYTIITLLLAGCGEFSATPSITPTATPPLPSNTSMPTQSYTPIPPTFTNTPLPPTATLTPTPKIQPVLGEWLGGEGNDLKISFTITQTNDVPPTTYFNLKKMVIICDKNKYMFTHNPSIPEVDGVFEISIYNQLIIKGFIKEPDSIEGILEFEANIIKCKKSFYNWIASPNK